MFTRTFIFILWMSMYIYAHDNISSMDKNGNTVLHQAVLENNLTRVKSLLKMELEIDDTNYDGQTALHLSVIKNYTKIVELLIENDATITKFDAYGFAPLYYAEYYNYIDVYNLLKSYGAKEKIQKTKENKFKKFIEDFDKPLGEEFFEENKPKINNKGYLKW